MCNYIVCRDFQYVKRIYYIVIGEISNQNCETNDIKRSIRNMENDMMKLNMLLHKESGIEHSLEQDNILMENEFIGSLKASVTLLTA